MITKMKNLRMIFLIYLLTLGINVSASENNNQIITKKMRSELNKLKTFIISQKTPNKIVPKPAPGRQNLVLSYLHSESTPGYKYVYSRSATYDNAAAIIALVILNEGEQAASIIESLMQNIRPNGDLWFIMNTHNYWPNEKDNVGGMIRTGTSSWAGYAVCFYIISELLDNPDTTLNNPKLKSYLEFSKKIANSVLTRQIIDEKDFRYGLITGGDKSIALKEENGKIIEKIVDKKIEWISIEHNIDSYFFLRDLAHISRNEKYNHAANILKKGILNTFNYHLGHFERGFNQKGPDPYRALDCASWGTMFLLAANQEKLATTTVNSLDEFKNTVNGLTGFRPYIDTTIYEGEEAQLFYFPDNPKIQWNDISFLWSEGSFGAALAYIRTGNTKAAIEIIASFLSPEMNVNGGIRYADQTIEQQFTNAPSVIGSAWAIITIKNLEGDKTASLFWSKSLPELNYQ